MQRKPSGKRKGFRCVQRTSIFFFTIYESRNSKKSKRPKNLVNWRFLPKTPPFRPANEIIWINRQPLKGQKRSEKRRNCRLFLAKNGTETRKNAKTGRPVEKNRPGRKHMAYCRVRAKVDKPEQVVACAWCWQRGDEGIAFNINFFWHLNHLE
jgi:hypothetical protein